MEFLVRWLVRWIMGRTPWTLRLLLSWDSRLLKLDFKRENGLLTAEEMRQAERLVRVSALLRERWTRQLRQW